MNKGTMIFGIIVGIFVVFVLGENAYESIFEQEIVSEPDQQSGEKKTLTADAGSPTSFDVDVAITNGTVKDSYVDPENFTIIIIIESVGDGIITLEFPRESFDAKKTDGTDDAFVILIDGTYGAYLESPTDGNYRKIAIEFEEADSKIEIFGTFMMSTEEES